jgi:PAS domain S-box-containing protein
MASLTDTLGDPALRALRVSESRYRRLFETARDGILLLNSDTAQIEDVNPYLIEMLGYTHAEFLGKKLWEVGPFADVAQSKEMFAELQAKGYVRYEDLPLKTKAGVPIQVEFVSNSYDCEGIKVIQCNIRNITKRKQAEVKSAQMEVQLRESQKMEALGTLAGGIAHDFNNALAMIVGNLELARQDVGPRHPALESLEEIAKASRRAKDLVQQILAFGRRQILDRKPTSLALVVLESARLLRASLPVKVSLTVECKADTPAVLADAGQINQILLNLCSNALQAVEGQERPGVIAVHLDASTLDEARGNLGPGRYARLSVRDNGPGMDEATRSHIFEPFFTTKQVSKGTGLGLSVVHSIVQAHDASIEVESTPGLGSTFCIYFPALEVLVADVMDSTSSTEPVHGKEKHILYVDDEKGLIFLMKRLLTRKGYRVSCFTDPREALAAARANPAQFDIVVTDYNMPYLSGLEVAEALREIRADLPVVLASGYITEELRAKAPAAGIRELIYKPNTVDDLCEAVERLAQTDGGKSKSS